MFLRAILGFHPNFFKIWNGLSKHSKLSLPIGWKTLSHFFCSTPPLSISFLSFFFFFLSSSFFPSFHQPTIGSHLEHFSMPESDTHRLRSSMHRLVNVGGSGPRREEVIGGGAKRPKEVCSFSVRFLATQPLDHRDSTSIQLLMSSDFIPYLEQPLKVTRKFLIFHAIWGFKAWSRPISGDFRGNYLRFLLVEKNSSKWHIIYRCLATFWKSHFSRLNYQLKLFHFICKANQDSKSGSEITYELVSMPRIHWRS